MRAEILRYEGVLSGIKLIGTNSEEREIIKRFFDGGAKPNALHGKELHLTFADLIEAEKVKDERLDAEIRRMISLDDETLKERVKWNRDWAIHFKILADAMENEVKRRGLR